MDSIDLLVGGRHVVGEAERAPSPVGNVIFSAHKIERSGSSYIPLTKSSRKKGGAGNPLIGCLRAGYVDITIPGHFSIRVCLSTVDFWV